MKHSGLGIASFTISLITGFLFFALIVIAGVMESSTPGGMAEDSPIAIVIGLGIFALLFVDVIALVLGIIGVCDSNKKKLFGILGIIFSLMVFLMVGGIMMLGFAMEA